ncbi:hypothetical protein HZH68_004734 [Vespula germanica]|uniref:Uncharacterized protein n=1 Tax=Vespula germanica TaxID=30212 RepID=A0A834KPA3_VESGE|nr:hypothetical protein HZH68_004734 [Vespula germanica]
MELILEKGNAIERVKVLDVFARSNPRAGLAIEAKLSFSVPRELIATVHPPPLSPQPPTSPPSPPPLPLY